jgi:hypothetical protein
MLRRWLLEGASPATGEAERDRALVSAAEAQGVAGLLAETADQKPEWSADARGRLEQGRRRLLVRGVRQLDLAARAQALLLAEGLRSLPLKGAALAERLYESPAHRAMSDVDLLVLDDPCRGLAILERAGFGSAEGDDHAWVMRDPVTGGLLELHASITSCPRLFPLDPDALWQRRARGTGQVPILPAPEDLLVHLALHAAFQHGLVLSLGQYLDFRRLIERLPLDVDDLLATARRARAEAALAAALAAAEIVGGAPIPAPIRARWDDLLPRRLRAWLSVRRAAPLGFVLPSRPSLAGLRLMLCSGRRFELLRHTLAAQAPGERLGVLAQCGRAAGRALHLLFRRP